VIDVTKVEAIAGDVYAEAARSGADTEAPFRDEVRPHVLEENAIRL
jgi:hypothetical protein